MSTRDESIRATIDWLAPRLRLQDWDIRHDPDTALVDAEDAVAMTWVRDHQKVATIRVASDTPDSQIPRAVAHELVHLVLLEYIRLVNHTLAKCGDAALGVVDHLAEVLERVCETIAEALTGIPWEPSPGENAGNHAPFVIDHSLARKEDQTSA